MPRRASSGRSRETEEVVADIGSSARKTTSLIACNYLCRMKAIWSRQALAVFLTAAVFYMINFAVSEGFNGGADSITHYQISKYSWEHDYLLIDQWGKPVFTILFSPIAQLGFKAVVLANIALVFLGAFWAMGIASDLRMKRPWLVALVVLWLPVVAGNSIAALTEMICSLFLIYYLRMALKERFILGGIVLGFMPFARSEGFVILALVLLFYAFTARWRYMPWLLVGSLVFNTLGYFITDKALWIFQSNPYVNTTFDMYGHGTFYHFFQYAVPLFGIAFVLWLLQTVREVPMALQIWKSRNWSLHDQVWVWLIAGSAWGYFLAHTVLWWQGMWASLGLGRVMFVIAVPIALMSVKGLEWLLDRLTGMTQRAVLATVIVLVIAGPFVVRMFSFQEIMIFPALGEEEKQNARAAEYLQANCNPNETKFFTAHPYLNLLLDVDPFNTDKIENLDRVSNAVPGDVIVWDGHFGPNEMKLPKDQLEADSSLKLLQVIQPETLFYTLNNYLYEIRIYRKQ